MRRRESAAGEVVQQVEFAQQISGPIPSADVLEQYARIDEGLPLRIVGWAEAETEHRQSLETEAVRADIRRRDDAQRLIARGQVLGASLAALAIVGGIVGALFAPSTAGQIGSLAFAGGGAAPLLWGPLRGGAAKKASDGGK